MLLRFGICANIFRSLKGFEDFQGSRCCCLKLRWESIQTSDNTFRGFTFTTNISRLGYFRPSHPPKKSHIERSKKKSEENKKWKTGHFEAIYTFRGFLPIFFAIFGYFLKVYTIMGWYKFISFTKPQQQEAFVPAELPLWGWVPKISNCVIANWSHPRNPVISIM